ncbi:MAG: TonB-dependent receptor [Pseudomonadota bacterium]
MPVTTVSTDQIVITASRVPESQAESAASTTIIDQAKIERLGEPLVPALLRLTPSAAITVQGPAGSLTEVRIRGAENNHTLFFIDGIRINDPASGDIPRFELLNADIASRIEVVRGPQSALWGSEAIGGVIAVNGTDDAPGFAGAAEAGSFGFLRGSASGAFVSGPGALAAAVGWQRSTGFDSFSGAGDKDGYRNLSGRLRGTYALSPSVRLGIAGVAMSGRNEFDGYDPISFDHTDTLDNSRNRLEAGRIWAEFGHADSGWSGQVGASLLGSSNRNYLDEALQNRTSGTRRALSAQVGRRFTTGPVIHRLVVAADAEHETFEARDIIYGGFSDQNRSREHQALTAEWRADAGGFHADVAVRRDMFNRFADATSVRASALAEIGGGFTLAGSYAEGIAQPTFFDLFGFFPGNFVGNPNLKPESSRGVEASLRFRRANFEASLTGYRQRLHNEIVDVFYPISTAQNSPGISRRAGIEAELGWRIAPQLRLSANYAYLKATEPGSLPDSELEERRRPAHTGSIALDGSSGPWSYGASLAYVGSHLDRTEIYPYPVVQLDSYWLAGARVAYAVKPGFELFVRGSNLLDEDYEDSAGYRTEGRGLFAGIRLAGRRSSP